MKKNFTYAILGVFVVRGVSLAENYTSEQRGAYNYAYSQKITTASSIENVDMNGELTRIAMAKMISNFATNILGLHPDTSRNCIFSDVSSSLDFQYNYGVTQACQLGIMGIGYDGKESDKFNPYGIVTRAQFATAYSRALSKANGDSVLDGQPYYKWHLLYLKNKGIIKDTNNPDPNSVEKRGNAMIMMMRTTNSKKNENIDTDNTNNTSNSNNTNNKITNYDWILGVEKLDTDTPNKLAIKITNKTKSKIQINSIHLSNVTLDNAIGVYQNDNTMDPEYLNRNTDKSIDVKLWYPALLNSGDSTVLYVLAEIEGGYAVLDSISFNINKNYKSYYFTKDTSIETERNNLFVRNDGSKEQNKSDGTKKTYYSNGQLHEVLNYKDGKLNGEYISYYYDGKINVKGHYKDNEKTGEWIEYFENGDIKFEGSYKNGELEGYAIWYCEKGEENQGYYRDGKCIRWEGDYKNGEYGGAIREAMKQYGTFNTYAFWTNEQVQSAEFQDNNGNRNGDYVSFYKNGQLKEQGQYKDDEKEGEWIEYFQDGSVASKGSYKNGKLDGYWIRYCEKGDDQCISLDGNYKNGEMIRN